MQFFTRTVCASTVMFALVLPLITYAEQSFFIQPISETQEFRFNNENWNLVEHPKVSSFIIFENGEMVGTTTTGVPFEQRIFKNSAGIKVHKYSIQEHYHYILSDRIYFTTEGLLAYLSTF